MDQGNRLSKAIPHLDPLASVYAAVGPQMTPQDAADIGNLLMPEWSPAQHREAGLAQQAIAQMFMGSDKEGHENQAMQAMAAAFVHLSAAGQMPADCIAPLDDSTPMFSVADDGSVSDAGVTKSGGVLGTTKGGRPVHIGDPLPEHNDKDTSSFVAHGKHVAAMHSSYSKQDHFDASFMHAKAAKLHGVSSKEGRHHMDMANAHVFAAPLKKSTTVRKGQQMITLQGLEKLQKAKYGTAPLGTTSSGKTVHGLRENMNAPIANGIIHAAVEGTPKQLSTHIHTFNPTFTHADHRDAAIAHKTEAATLRSKAARAKTPQRAYEHMANAERHSALAVAHYHAAKATGRGTGPSRKPQPVIKSGAADVLKAFLSKAEKGEGSRGGKVIGHTRSNKPIYSHQHESYHTPVKVGKETLSAHQALRIGNHTVLSKVARVMKQTHPDWTQEDHEDAKAAHGKRGLGDMKDVHSIAANVMNRRRVLADERVAGNAYRKRIADGKVTKSEAWMDLFKAGGKGEGSRGGHIIGHTKSQKPVYSAISHDGYKKVHAATEAQASDRHIGKVAADAHPSYTKQDHVDASKLHLKMAQAEGGPKIGHTAHAGNAANAHRLAAYSVSKSFSMLVKAEKGEGSRGGKVIGHTRAGKPIYAASHDNYTKAYGKGESTVLGHALNKDWNKAGAAAIRAHKGWSAADHFDAADAHNDAASAHHHDVSYGNAISPEHHEALKGAASIHQHLAAVHSRVGLAMAGKETAAKKSRKAVSGKRRLGFGVEKPKTISGKAIPKDGSSKYTALDKKERHAAVQSDWGNERQPHQKALAQRDADAIAHHFKGWSKQDHQDAVDHHVDGGYHQAAMAHRALADRADAKKSLGMQIDALTLAKGFAVAPTTYFWGQPQHRVN